MPKYATHMLLAVTLLFILAAASPTPYFMMIMQFGTTIMAVAILIFLYLALKHNTVSTK
jgi:succinate dehydrogenase hydrophobic anchor subunit